MQNLNETLQQVVNILQSCWTIFITLIGIYIFIKHYIAHEFGVMQMNDQFNGTQKYNDSIDYEFVAQRWLEKCR